VSSGRRDLNVDLVTASEVAVLIGKTRQRVDQLDGTPGFPVPAFRRDRIRLWWRADIEAWVSGKP
jgi:hypothetical protein